VKQSYNRTEPSQEETRRYGVEFGQNRTAEILRIRKNKMLFINLVNITFVSRKNDILSSSYPSPGVDLSLTSEESAIIRMFLRK
jgi:hypothetical protein